MYICFDANRMRFSTGKPLWYVLGRIFMQVCCCFTAIGLFWLVTQKYSYMYMLMLAKLHLFIAPLCTDVVNIYAIDYWKYANIVLE